jgi:hypothetical protein
VTARAASAAPPSRRAALIRNPVRRSALRDPKLAIRLGAIEALRATLIDIGDHKRRAE